MAKRIKKPPIRPEQRREWLKRFEVDGESPPQIATKDHYDIRTVRKQIDLAKEEREVREARTLVLRSALEKHYEDLRNYAERQDVAIREESNVIPSPDDDLIKDALRQHLPRSPLWGYLIKREAFGHTLEEQEQLLERTIEKMVKADRRLKTMNDAGLDGVAPGVIELLDHEVEKHWLRGNIEFTLRDNLIYEPTDDEKVSPSFGFSHMGVMSQEIADKYMPIVCEVVRDLESRIKASKECLSLEKTSAEIVRVKGKLREELAIIRLRRIIPGRCKYCPL